MSEFLELVVKGVQLVGSAAFGGGKRDGGGGFRRRGGWGLSGGGGGGEGFGFGGEKAGNYFLFLLTHGGANSRRWFYNLRRFDILQYGALPPPYIVLLKDEHKTSVRFSVLCLR